MTLSSRRKERDNVERMCDLWAFENPVPEPLLKEKVPFGVSSVSGTIYKDYRYPIEHAKANRDKLLPLHLRGLQQAYNDARANEEKKAPEAAGHFDKIPQ